MINFKEHGINYEQSEGYSVVVNDLVAIGNIDRKTVDTFVLEDISNGLVVEGEHDVSNTYAVVGGEIIYITESLITQGKTTFSVERGRKGTTKSNQVGYRCRTVRIVEEDNGMSLLDWSFEDGIGNISNNLFPCDVSGGHVTIASNIYLWSALYEGRDFWVRPKKTMVYIFKGVGEKRFLKHTGVVSKLELLSKTPTSVQKVKLEIKTKLSFWYEKDLAVNIQFKGTRPKDFFTQLFSLKEQEVYYSSGVTDESFIKINNLNSREYTKFSDLLKAYCSNGVRFVFDRFERVKIFSDFKIDNIESSKCIYEDVLNPSLTTNDKLVYNTVDTEVVQRLPMYNYADLNEKAVSYSRVLRGAVRSNGLLVKNKDGSIDINMLGIRDYELSTHATMGDIVCFKGTIPPYIEVFAKVIDVSTDGTTSIFPITSDKDNKLFLNGKSEYLYNLLNSSNITDMDLYYSRNELPIVGKFIKNVGGKDIDSSMLYPILPKIDGAFKNIDEKNFKFGCASNLKVGKYTGIVEEVDKLYGSFNSSKLLYNKEIEQFDGVNPPIFALSNQVVEREVDNRTYIMDFTTFDNSDLLIDIEKPKDLEFDMTVKLYNNKSVNSNTDLLKGEEKSRLGNRLLQVDPNGSYSVGDVLVLNRPEDLNATEEKEFDEVLSLIKWVVIRKSYDKDDPTKMYIEVDSDFARRQQRGKIYTFTKYPYWSIVYLQELYFRGNPVLEFTQKVNQQAKGLNFEGDRSVDIFGTKKYTLDSKQLDKNGVAMMLGYILNNCESTTVSNTKLYAPISTYNGIDIEALDVITVKEPTYTKITDDMKWLVTSIQCKNNSNVVQLRLLNLNSSNTKPFDMDVKDMLEYAPVDVPTYSPNGSEGTPEENFDNGEGYDPSIGTFKMAEVDPQIFKAKISKVEGKHIYFDNYGGKEWEIYVSKLFPRAEFGITVKGESFLMKSDMKDRAFIRKRDVYAKGDKVELLAGDDVSFLTMSYYVDIDGKFYSRNCKIGDGDSYFEYDLDKGAKFVGDFTVGSSNQTIDNDLWLSLQKNKTFQQTYPPQTNTEYKLRSGDLWYDTDDENHLYSYNGSAWVSCRDKSILTAGSTSFIEPNPPINKPGRPLREGDTWYDSDDNYKVYTYVGGAWVDVSDKSLKGLIDDAKKQSDEALKGVADISSDNKASPSEKLQLKKDWDIIFGEYPKIVDECNKFGVSTTAYDTAYNRLNSFVFPLFTSMDTTSDIDGVSMRERFTDYYNNRQLALNKVSDSIMSVTSMQNGKMLYLDPTFKQSSNDVLVYNTLSNGLVTHQRLEIKNVGDQRFPPNDSGCILSITKRNGVVSPGSGGFRLPTQARQGVRFLTKIIAMIPVGYTLKSTSGSIGSGGRNFWVTEQKGEGKYKEYALVTECGYGSEFGTTTNIYIESDTADHNRGVEWYLSYVTVFDSSSSDIDYVTQALGNSKIFHSDTPPIQGMKKNDLWYDTDDDNHPYIYDGNIWISARDKVYEHNGNKYYFTNYEPPSSGSGTKDGDMWFNTNANNTMYVLQNGVWVLANDAMDKINKGKITLNGNTTVLGSFKVTGDSVELNADTSVTGTLSIFGGNGLVTYNGFTEASSTRRTMLTSGGLLFQQRI